METKLYLKSVLGSIVMNSKTQVNNDQFALQKNPLRLRARERL